MAVVNTSMVLLDLTLSGLPSAAVISFVYDVLLAQVCFAVGRRLVRPFVG